VKRNNIGEHQSRSDVSHVLLRAEEVIHWIADPEPPRLEQPPKGSLHVGVDLGTAYLVLVVLDDFYQPIAGEYQFAEVVRDGLVVDFIKAIDLASSMKEKVEKRIGVKLHHAASGYPPGIPRVETQAVANVIDAAGFECTTLKDEPSAANQLLRIENGAVVDIGGGTTGIAVINDGKVVYTADEPTGGTHFSLVIAGALDIPFKDAEALKIRSSEHGRLFPLVRPVMEKIGTIITTHIRGHSVENITLVGGTAAFLGIADVVEEATGIPTSIPDKPLFVTPIGIAMSNQVT
jgi:ethanolamine utilization protein EutJ